MGTGCRKSRKGHHQALRPVALLPAIERIIRTANERCKQAQTLRPEQMIPFLSFLSAVIVGGAAGKLICTAVRSAVSKRRSRTLNVVVLAAAGIGGLIPRLTGIRIIIEYYIEMGMVLSGLTQILMSLLYVIVLCLTIRFDLEGMIFRR